MLLSCRDFGDPSFRKEVIGSTDIQLPERCTKILFRMSGLHLVIIGRVARGWAACKCKQRSVH